MSTKSLALTLVRPGTMELRQVFQDERLRPGELLVQVEYSSVQPLDGEMFNCSGMFADLQLPHVMGVEGVGVVLKSASDHVPEGARIAFLLRKFFNDDRHGTWQKRLVLDEKRAMILQVPPVVGLNQIAELGCRAQEFLSKATRTPRDPTLAAVQSPARAGEVAALAFLKPFAPQSQIIHLGEERGLWCRGPGCHAAGGAHGSQGPSALRGHEEPTSRAEEPK
ncbi:Uncharacterized protein SCF082_LOCUS17947 [Durusdinium trenchii]|uniref:Alcohol dehydrogenase-like N-terminal domain-containing protein n=1 Tax=Durusdinium trenchii TaxID=1381693 RepID=A0ABP0KLX5_9DINO